MLSAQRITAIGTSAGGFMNESWKKYMKMGLIHFMAYPQVIRGEGPILETLEKIVYDEFFDAVEITHIKDPSVREKTGKLLASGKLTVAYGGQPVLMTNKLNLNSFDAGERQKALDRCKAAVDEAYELSAVGIGFLSGADPGPEKRGEATELLLDSLDQLCSYTATKGGMRVALETFDREIDKKVVIGPHKEAVALSARLRKKHANFGLMVDLSHFPLQFESTREALLTSKEHIIHAHMGNCVVKDKNNPGYGDLHPRFGFPGGETDVAELTEFLRVLLEIGYLNKETPRILSFEVKPMTDETSELVIANAKRTFLQAWERI